MRYWLIISVFYPFLAEAQLLEPTPINPRDNRSYSKDEAYDITTKALLQEPSVKSLVKNSEQIVWRQLNYVGLSEKIVRPVATVAAPLIAGKISTKGLHFHWEPIRDVEIRPDVDYYMRNGEYSYNLNLNWEF